MRVVIDNRGVVQSNPEAGTSVNVAGNIIATGLTVNGTITASGITLTSQANPTYYVASTGSDTAAGTISAPLLTLQEACNRLRSSGWTGQATVVTKDTINLGANPTLDVPAPAGSGLPIIFQTTYQTDLAGAALGGGTQGTLTGTIVGATAISNVAAVTNAHRGKVLVWGGPGSLSGTRYIIHANDSAGVYTFPARLVAAPISTDTFIIQSRLGAWTWSGDFTVLFSALVVDGISFLPTGAGSRFVPVGEVLQDSACLWTSAAVFSIVPDGCLWQTCWTSAATALTSASRQLFNGVTPCGTRYDGTAGIISILPTTSTKSSIGTLFQSLCSYKGVDVAPRFGLSRFAALSIFDDCGFELGQSAAIRIENIRIENGRAVSGNTSIMSFGGEFHLISNAFFATPTAGFDLIAAGLGLLEIAGVGGVAVGAGKVALAITLAGTVVSLGANTATGVVPGVDITVDGGAGFPIATLATQGVIGATRGTYIKSTDNSATPATTSTVNKLSGRESLNTASGTTFTITNSLAKTGDDVFVQLITRDATAVAPIASVTVDGTIVVTFNAAATAPTKFAWWLKKSGV